MPEGREIFPSLTVEDNLSLGQWTRRREPGTGEAFTRAYDYFPRFGVRERKAR